MNRARGRWIKMGRANLLICPNCDYKRHLTEAESLIAHALVVACLKCGAAMQGETKGGAQGPCRKQSLLDSCGLDALEELTVP